MPIKDIEKRKAHHRKYLYDRYHNDPNYNIKHRDNVRKAGAARVLKIKEVINSFRKDGCVICKEKEFCCLSAHHLDPTKKDFSISVGKSRRMAPGKVSAELEKCICVCENCHRKIHAGLITL